MSNIVAIVKSLVGQVFAVSLDGLKRQIFEGERLLQGEQVMTGLGGEVTLQLANGELVDVGQGSNWQAENPEGEDASAERAPNSDLEQALAAGFDPTTDLDATAAGAGAGGGTGGGAAGGGHSFVLLGETGEQLEATVGFETSGLGIADEAIDEEPGINGDVTVNPINDATVVANDSVAVDEDGSVIIDVLANDADIDSAKSPVTSVTQGSNGTVAINLDGTVTYTPNADFNGNDSFTYTNAEGATATVNVTVNPINDATVVANDSVAVDEDGSVIIDVLANDADIDSAKSP
ncbi:MAG TPA: retention module-containing protein, partial [Pseudomonas sp.]|nr:retention module-containing protein [Pseudomonas sp.]